MRNVLIYVTVIFALFALPITTIFWWPGFWGAQADYWYPWIPKLEIAAAVIAGLWLIQLIPWLRERRPRVRLHRGVPYHQATVQHSTSDEPYYQATAQRSTSDEPSSEPDWIVDEHGRARRPHDKPQGEPQSYPVPEALDYDPVSWAKEYVRETKKQAKDFLDPRRIRNR